MYYVVFTGALSASPINTLKVFTKFHIGVTNVVYKHHLGVKRKVAINIMGCTVNTCDSKIQTISDIKLIIT